VTINANARIGVVGGTGPQGQGLAIRWARAGLSVVIGSRSRERAEQIAEQLGQGITGAVNEVAAAQADICIIAIPWAGHAETLTGLRSELRGKIVVDCVNPLGFDGHGPFALPVVEGSAAQQAQQLLPESTVVAAFHHLSAPLLCDLAVESIDSDVLVLGEDRDVIATIIELAEKIDGVRGVYAGRLRNAHQVEALTANLIAINRRYKSHAGIRVTDV
jgi:NADPH-dependent F420 reductase